MEIILSTPSREGGLTIFGIAADKDTVNGDPLFTYRPKSIVGNVHKYEIVPVAPRILIKVVFKGLRWRSDKEYFSESLQSYCSDILLDYRDETIEIDLNEYLEHDYCEKPRPQKKPLITVTDHSTYRNINSSQTILRASLQPISSSPNYEKNIVFKIRSSDRISFEHFKHSLPREINWLLYGPLTLNGNIMEGVFLNYKFGAVDHLDHQLLGREPWREDKSLNGKLIEYKRQFVSRLKEWGNITPYFLNTRELLQFFPRYLVQDDSLQLKDIYGGNNPQLWHYFSASKFLHFIQSKRVWFSRPSLFSDPFESKTNKATRAHQVQVVMRQMIQEYNVAVHEEDSKFIAIHDIWASEMIKNENGTIVESTFTSFKTLPNGLHAFAENRLESINNSLLVNCWHQNENESDGMWDLYADRQFGVAITSTPEKIRNSFAGESVKLNITPIEYHDLHKNDTVFDSLPVGYKHIAFNHEQEYRVYLSGYPLLEGAHGVSLPTNFDILVDRIVLAPKCPDWYKSTIEWVLKAASIEIRAEDSIFTRFCRHLIEP